MTSLCKQVIQSDWTKFEDKINRVPGSKVDVINQIYAHMISDRGKRLRAKIVLLMSRALNYNGLDHIELACIVEWLHAATLIHDDIIDNSAERSKQKSTHVKFGNTCAVLGGDYLYGMAFKKISDLRSPDITAIIANATTNIIEGELFQLQSVQMKLYDIDTYKDIISRKTACLFKVCSEAAVVISGSVCNNARMFGFHFGMAYQMLDDLQDYLADEVTLGRMPGSDYLEGKLNLPYILARPNLDNNQIDSILQRKLDIPAVINLLDFAQGFVKCQAHIEQSLHLAKDCLVGLPDSEYKASLLDLVLFCQDKSRLLLQSLAK